VASLSAVPNKPAPAGPQTRKSADSERRRVLPPRVRTGQKDRIYKLGSKLALNFWQSASTDQRWRSKQTAAHSPLACLHRLYGASGALWAVGVAPADLPDSVTSFSSVPVPGQPEKTSGFVESSSTGRRYSFCLRWTVKDGVAVVYEVLPEPLDCACLPVTTHLPSPVANRLHYPPAPRVQLGAVESAIWQTGLPVVGLSIVLRAMALGNLAAGTGGPGIPDPILAPSLLYVCLKRSGKKVTLGQVGSIFDLEGSLLRDGVRQLQLLVRRNAQSNLGWL